MCQHKGAFFNMKSDQIVYNTSNIMELSVYLDLLNVEDKE